MSEFDSLSDSDWLDVASRASDDNDSVGSHDDFSSRPLSRLSRRSSISFGSSHESEVEAWEGFVDESGDESAVESGMCIVRPLVSHPTEPVPIGHIPDISHDSSDDRLVKEALDQSMVGTLSASRTSSTSHSTHSSIRDLRLSFPDPLTSSRDQVGKLYPEALESDSPTNDAETTISLTDSIVSSSEPKPEPVAVILQAPHHEVTQQDNAATNLGLDIILYGASSSIKWSFVQDFIQKAANFSGNVVLNTLDPDAGPIQTLSLRCGKDNSILTTISVHDCTNVNSNATDTFDMQDDVIRASLAIVYLPTTTLPILSLHSAYLPVLVPGTAEEDKGSALLHAAEDDWELLAVPTNRTLDLNPDRSCILPADALFCVDSWKVFGAIRAALDNPIQPIRTVVDNGRPIHAVTFFALVSIIMGFAFNTAFRTPMPIPTGTVKGSSGNAWKALSANQINRSLVAPVAGTSTALATSSLKDFALSVLTPGITSLSVNPSGVNSLSLTSRVNSLSISGHHPSSLSLVHTPSTSLAVPGPSRQPTVVPNAPQASSSKDVLVRPTTPTSLSEVHPEPSMTMATRTQKRSHPDFTLPNAVSVRFTSGLSEVMDVGAKIFSNAARLEKKDLVEAMDELMNAIHAQSQTVVSQGKGKARAIGEEVVSRNVKARGRARELKKKGEEFLNTATTQFFERTEIARQRAKGLKGSLWQSPAWKSYERVHAEWVSRLKDAGQCARDKPGWRDVEDSWETHRPAGVHRVSCPPLTAR